MTMLDKFPRLLGIQDRICMGRTEMMEVLKEWASINKSCEVGLYSFEEWLDGEPIKETVIVDVVMFHGTQERLKELGEKFRKEGKKGFLVHDGSKLFLLVETIMPLFAPIEGFPDIQVEQNVLVKLVHPGCFNLRTRKKSEIVERFIP